MIEFAHIHLARASSTDYNIEPINQSSLYFTIIKFTHKQIHLTSFLQGYTWLQQGLAERFV